MSVLRKISKPFINLYVFLWDNILFLLNLVVPAYQVGHVIQPPNAGHGGIWPAYTPPTEGDSRCACPMLNAMANHGILPHDGKNISFKEMNIKIRQTFNFAPSFCFFVPKFAADFLDRSYWNDRFDLHELSLHNAIEHDASLTRQDSGLVADQAKPDLKLVQELLSEATGQMPDGSPRLTIPDLSRALSKRRLDAKRTNPNFSDSFFHNMFGSANSSTMLTLFGGSVAELTPMLTEERFVDKWEPHVRARFGLTMAKFNGTVLPVELGVSTKKAAQREAQREAQASAQSNTPNMANEKHTL